MLADVPGIMFPVAWSGAAIDMRNFSSVTIGVTTAPTTVYAPQWSPDNTNWYALSGLDLNFNVLTSIAPGFTGAVTFQGGSFIRLNGGTGGSFQISGGN